jgi:hypothetical protein
MKGEWKKAVLSDGATALDWMLQNHRPNGQNLTHLQCSEHLTAALGYPVSLNTVRSAWQQAGQAAPLEVAISGKGANPVPHIEGLTADDRIPDPSAVWRKAIEAQQTEEAKDERRNTASISFDAGCGPIGIAFLSDLHFGSAGVCYDALRSDAELVRDTPGLYAAYIGDGLDNWIVGNLMALQRSQVMTHKEALALHEDWLRTMGDKLLICVAGNHDKWSQAVSGLSYLRDVARDLPCLYDDDECAFTLSVGPSRRVFKLRHKWRGNSIYNPTHAIERDARFGDTPFDVGVGGHVHTGWYARNFHVHGRDCLAVQVGAYKRFDSFGRSLGFPETKHRGSGCLIIDEDGTMTPFQELREAAEYLTYKRRGLPA